MFEKLQLAREQMQIRSLLRRMRRAGDLTQAEAGTLDKFVRLIPDESEELQVRLYAHAAGFTGGPGFDFLKWLIEFGWENRAEIMRIIKEIIDMVS